jgi:phosphatidylglycerophosphatase A
MAKPPIPSTVWTNPIHFLAFGFGAGTLPFAPGTWGTVIAIPLYLLVAHTSLLIYSIITLIIIVAGIWICDVAEKASGVRDHSGIVWDEIAGFFVTMLAAPKGIIWIAIGFILFRIFDVWKPQPIRWVDQHVDGGLGIMVDDIIAAVYAWIILQLLARLV